MLKRILATLDGSENAEKILPWIRQYASREHAQVLLLRVLPPGIDLRAGAREREEARDYLLRMEKELNYAGIPARILVRRGRPAEEIVAVAKEQDADLILMATRGDSSVKRWAVGGVTEQVLRLSPVPVLPVRSHLAMEKQGRIRRIIVPVDGSSRAQAAVRWSSRLARMFRAKLIFLHVRPEGGAGFGTRKRAALDALEERFRRICAQLAKQGIPASFHTQKGDAAHRIICFADRNDLILTTTHGFGGFKRWIFGSVAEKLIHEAGVPVLVYKSPA